MFRESGPQSNTKFEEKVKKWYQQVLDELEEDGFKVTPTEAVFLRQTIRDIFNENDKTEKEIKKTGKGQYDLIFTYPEIFERFFWHFYKINIPEYFRGIKQEDREKARKDLYKYVQELRKDRELI